MREENGRDINRERNSGSDRRSSSRERNGGSRERNGGSRERNSVSERSGSRERSGDREDRRIQENRRRQNRKKNTSQLLIKLGIYCGVALVIGLVLGGIIGRVSGTNSIKKAWEDEVTSLNEDITGLEAELENALAADTNDESSDDEDGTQEWYLRLVNYANPLAEDEVIETSTVAGTTYEVDTRIVEYLEDMLEGAEADGVDAVICSAFRDWDYQETLFNNSMANYISQGYGYYDAYQLTGEYIAEPGTSEHALGLAVDIVDASYQMLDDDQQYTECAIWLKENSYKYGFILRYPEEKEDITQIGFESWHYRYVGVEAATIIMENDITLEEYLEQY